MADQRLKGQEISVRIINNGVLVDSIDAISSFNDTVALELKEAGFLGEVVNRFDEILNGYGGDFEFNIWTARWLLLRQAIIAKATRQQPALRFNVIRTDLYPNGDSTIFTYADVSWGEVPTSVGSRGDYAKVRMLFKCSELAEQINQLP